MKTNPLLLLLALIPPSPSAALPTDEAGAIAYLEGKGVSIMKNAAGQATRLMSSGKPALSVAEYQLIGRLRHLEQMGLNASPLQEGEWGFLRELPGLKQLSIWHGSGFATLEPFSGLRVESLTIGGCMGLRDKNRDHPDRLRHAIKTLRDLPNVRRANLYHSPLAPDDSHLAHLVEQCPKLEDLRLDFTAPRGSTTTITPAGLAVLQRRSITTLSLENAQTFTPEHFQAIAGIKSLRALLVDSRRTPVPAEGLAAFQRARPDVEVAVAAEGASGPPQLKRKK